MNKPFTLDKSGIAQSYHFGRFVQDAKRPTKILFFTREIRPNTLRWSEFRSVNLQIYRPFGFHRGSQLGVVPQDPKAHVGCLDSDLSEIATLFGVRSSGKYKISRYSRAFSSQIVKTEGKTQSDQEMQSYWCQALICDFALKKDKKVPEDPLAWPMESA